MSDTEDKKRERKIMRLGNPMLDNGIKKHMRSKLPAIWNRFTKQEFADVVEKHFGIVTVCCNVLDCSYR